MQKLKFLHFPGTWLVFALVPALVLGGCAASGNVASPDAAEKFAVALANDACLRDFGKKPFKTGRFPAARSSDRWLWGWLDAAGTGGFTAQVSFHADRSEPQVAVRLGAESQVDLEEPDAPSLDGNGGPEKLTRQPEPKD